METQVELAKRSVRFMKLFPVGVDRDIILLKGHLLIEELITEIIRDSVKGNPIGLRISNNMMFANKLNLLWMSHRKFLDEYIWIGLKKLNSIRNKMSHEIDPKNIDERIDEFISLVFPMSAFREESHIGRELEYSITWLHIVVSQCLHKLKNS